MNPHVFNSCCFKLQIALKAILFHLGEVSCKSKMAASLRNLVSQAAYDALASGAWHSTAGRRRVQRCEWQRTCHILLASFLGCAQLGLN